jgi:hypothetical protein
MTVSNPRSRFGFELVEQPLYSGASECPLSSNLPSCQQLVLLQFAPGPKSVGDDTWQSMRDWRPTSSNLVVPDFRPVRTRTAHWFAQYIALER